MGRGSIICAEMTKEELAELECKIRKDYGAHISEEQVSKIIHIECNGGHSRAQYRVAATRALTGGRRVKTGERSVKGMVRSLTGRLVGGSSPRNISKKKVLPAPVDEEAP